MLHRGCLSCHALEPTYEGLKLAPPSLPGEWKSTLEPTYEGLKLWDHSTSWEGYPNFGAYL